MDENTSRWIVGLQNWAKKVNALTIAYNSGQITSEQYINAIEERDDDEQTHSPAEPV